MGITAENLAAKYNITREECDAFALKSQTNWAKGRIKYGLLNISLKNFSNNFF